jgi:hypothetical protein
MANIIDLLMEYKQTVKINDNISFFYIVYQVCRSMSIKVLVLNISDGSN